MSKPQTIHKKQKSLPTDSTANEDFLTHSDPSSARAYLGRHSSLNISAEECTAFQPITDPIPLHSLSNTHTPPALVRIRSDYHSPMGIMSLHEGQIMVIMAIQSAKVITALIEDEYCKMVPVVEKIISFSPLENGTQHTYTYSELLQADPLPVIVSPMRTFTDKKRQKLIERGTRLLLKHKSSRIKREKTLRITDLNQIDITVPENTDVTFSAKPEDVCLSPEETVKHFTFPILVKPVSNDDDINTIPKIELRRAEIEEVIVGMIRYEEVDMPITFMPSSIPVMLEIIKTENESKLLDIYMEARKDYIHTKSSSQLMDAQKLDNLYENPAEWVPFTVAQYNTITVSPLPSESLQTAQFSTYDIPRPHPKVTDNGTDSGYRKFQAMSNPYQCPPVGHSQTTADPIKPSPKPKPRVKPTPKMISVAVQTSEINDESDGATLQNQMFVKSLPEVKILLLLQGMGLECYCESFKREMIDGELFSSLDDELLIELGVTKSIHRLRIKKIANGSKSAKDILVKESKLLN